MEMVPNVSLSRLVLVVLVVSSRKSLWVGLGLFAVAPKVSWHKVKFGEFKSIARELCLSLPSNCMHVTSIVVPLFTKRKSSYGEEMGTERNVDLSFLIHGWYLKRRFYTTTHT